MKNILTFATVILTAGMTHAASLNWTAANIYQPGTTTASEGYVAYLFITAQNKNFGADTTTVGAVTDLIKSGAEFYTDTDTGKSYLKKGNDKISIAATGTSVNGRVSGATGYNGNNFGAGDSLSGFAVIFDASTLAAAKNYIVTDTKSASWTSSTGAKPLGFGSQANNTWTPVPEPSTAALALAGLALLLKRRRA